MLLLQYYSDILSKARHYALYRVWQIMNYDDVSAML
jgi:hypothetical protein